jgi:integrase
MNGEAGRPATLAMALDRYAADLRARSGDVVNASSVRGHLTQTLLSKPVTLLTADELRRWRDALLDRGLKPGTALRLVRALTAALNLAASLDSRINRSVWQRGLAGLRDTYRPVNRVLTDADVLAIVNAAYERDPHFGLFIDVLASTGARTSQACRLLVADLQADRPDPRLMMPPSRKGSHKESSRRPVPIPDSLARKLQQATGDRGRNAPLLTRAGGSARKSQGSELCLPARRSALSRPTTIPAWRCWNAPIARSSATTPIRSPAAACSTRQRSRPRRTWSRSRAGADGAQAQACPQGQ